MKLIYLEEIESTNKYCKENIEKLEDKSVIYTSKQTQGRGRFNRKWVDLGSENIFMSIVLKPEKKFADVFYNFTQYTALCLAYTLENYKVNPKIKWPNDILINGKKISGILAESVIRNTEIKGIIIGIGINLNANKTDFTKINKDVTALNIEKSQTINKLKFLNEFTETFFKSYDTFLEKGFPLIKKDYLARTDFLNKNITITNFNEKITGIAKSITNKGTLILTDENNINHEFMTGEY